MPKERTFCCALTGSAISHTLKLRTYAYSISKSEVTTTHRRQQGHEWQWRVFHVWRDKLSSIAYSEKLNSFTISATLQSTDRRYGIVGQKSADFQLDSRKR